MSQVHSEKRANTFKKCFGGPEKTRRSSWNEALSRILPGSDAWERFIFQITLFLLSTTQLLLTDQPMEKKDISYIPNKTGEMKRKKALRKKCFLQHMLQGVFRNHIGKGADNYSTKECCFCRWVYVEEGEVMVDTVTSRYKH